MPSAFRNPKNLNEWLRLDYFRYPRRLPRLRRLLGWLTLFLCVALLGAAFLHKSEAMLYQAGPLTHPHAMFNNDCAQCHVENFTAAQRFLPWNRSLRSVPDSACLKCHDGPIHSEKMAVTENCVSCHQEHRGHASLVRLPDSRCVACHRNLKANSLSGQDCEFADIGGFPNGHVEFRSIGEDTGTIKFNHAKHYKLKTSSRTDPLECADCHKPDAAGRYMQPIKYENNCKECHPLSVQLGGTFEGKALTDAAAAFAKEPAPHAAPRVVRAMLRERLLQFMEKHPLLSIETPVADERGKPGPRSTLDAGVAKMRWEQTVKTPDEDRTAFLRGQLALSEQLCFDRTGGCVLCHVETTTKRVLGRDLPEYAESRIPSVWFPHSRFDHQAHRLLDCMQCHPGADKSNQARDVMMPSLQTCASCHNPRTGARSDCVECHTYHHNLGPPRKLTIGESLKK